MLLQDFQQNYKEMDFTKNHQLKPKPVWIWQKLWGLLDLLFSGSDGRKYNPGQSISSSPADNIIHLSGTAPIRGWATVPTPPPVK